jgi:hypothetical protein
MMKKSGQGVLGLTVLDRRLNRNGGMNNVFLKRMRGGKYATPEKEEIRSRRFLAGYCVARCEF